MLNSSQIHLSIEKLIPGPSENAIISTPRVLHTGFWNRIILVRSLKQLTNI